MRVAFAVILAAAGLCCGSPVQAADLGAGFAGVAHAGAVAVYDFEPGVVMRAYWVAPWGGRHYFPAGGPMPALGRDEHLPANPVIVPAKSYHRKWSSLPGEPLAAGAPVVYAPQQYFPQASAAAAPPEISK